MTILHAIEQRMKQFAPEGIVFEDSGDPEGESAGEAAAEYRK